MTDQELRTKARTVIAEALETDDAAKLASKRIEIAIDVLRIPPPPVVEPQS